MPKVMRTTLRMDRRLLSPQGAGTLRTRWLHRAPIRNRSLTGGVARQRRLKTTAPTISKWRKRFLAQRMDGLMQERHPGQKPNVITPQLQAKVLSATRRKPSDGSTHWSCRKLAKHLGIRRDVVHCIWGTAGLQPHRAERYLASNDPDFERKAADIIGLYLNPPQHAAVFCVDEKSAIQGLDRLDPVLPMSPARAERHEFEYYRHGTLSLYAALDVKTGKVHGKTAGSSSSLCRTVRT